MPKRTRNRSKAGTPERDWPEPHLPSEGEFGEFCRDFDIGPKKAVKLRAFLGELLFHVGNMRLVMREQGRLAEIRKESEIHAKQLVKVIEWLYRFDKYLLFNTREGSEFYAHPDAVAALQKAANEHLSPLLDPWFVCQLWGCIPSSLAPEKREVKAVKFDYDRGRDFVSSFTKQSADTSLVVVLEAVRKTLVQAAKTMKAETRKGGKDRYEIAPMVLTNFAEIYHLLGRAPQREGGKRFRDFAEALVTAIGWHATWVETYIEQALVDWSERHEKSNPA